MIQFEIQENKHTLKSTQEVLALKEEFASEYRELVNQKSDFAEYIDSTLMNKNYISSQIKNTDMLITSKLCFDQVRHENFVKQTVFRKRHDYSSRFEYTNIHVW